MSRRANNEGSVYKRTDGRWCATVSVDGGRRKSFYGRTRKEVSDKLTDGLKAHQDGLPLAGERLTVGQLLDNWLETIRPSLRPKTWQRYEEVVRLHLRPRLGNLRLAHLSAQQVQRLYADRLAAGLAPRTVRYVHAVLHAALQQATKWGLVARNVADLVTPPRADRYEMATLDPEQARSFLDAAAGDRFESLFTLAVTTGMRQGELLGLHWRDLDLERGTLQVRASLQRTRAGLVVSEPKTPGSRRQIALTSAAVAVLRHHRAAQGEERLRLGPAWQDSGLVFADEVGGPVTVSRLINRHFRPILSRAALPVIRFHDLRHTAATLLLADGTHPKIVSEMLGHSQISITLDLYSHVTPTMQRQAAEAMDKVLAR